MIKKSKRINGLSINPKIGRNINRVLILNSIRERQPISRVRISELTGLNKSTVSSIVSALIEENLVAEDIDRNQAIGRNPLNLRVKSGENFVGALYFDSLKTDIAIVDISGEIIVKEEVETNCQDPVKCIDDCVQRLRRMQLRHSIEKLRGLGVTVAGIVDSTHSKVIYAPNMGWYEFDIGRLLQERMTDIDQIIVENDAKASALAELTMGHHPQKPGNFVFLSIGPGIGAGIVIDDHILSGNSYAAGEFGHFTIIENGTLCTCGNKGCWEMYASDKATIQWFARKKGLSPELSSKLFMEDVIIAANTMDPVALESLRRSAQYIGLGLANIIRSFDPELIIIGGAITQVWDIMYPTLLESVNARGFFGYERTNRIIPTTLTGNPPLLGAAALAIKELFTDYRITRS